MFFKLSFIFNFLQFLVHVLFVAEEPDFHNVCNPENYDRKEPIARKKRTHGLIFGQKARTGGEAPTPTHIHMHIYLCMQSSRKTVIIHPGGGVPAEYTYMHIYQYWGCDQAIRGFIF